MIDVYTYIGETKGLTSTQREFMQAYAEALLWSSVVLSDNDIDDTENAEEYSHVCSQAFCDSVIVDCLDHLKDAGALIKQAIQDTDVRYSIGQAGHDFALTRNHHGAGYWDRGLGAIGDTLSALADQAGSIELYIGDDGLLYDI